MATRRIKLARGRPEPGVAEPAPKGPTHLPMGTLVRIDGVLGFYRITGVQTDVDDIRGVEEHVYSCTDAFLGVTETGLGHHRAYPTSERNVTVVTRTLLSGAIAALEADMNKLESLLLAMEDAGDDDDPDSEADGVVW